MFLLVLCLTGLPLIFHDEIDAWFEDHAPVSTGAPRVSLDRIVEAGRALYPGNIIAWIAIGTEKPQIVVAMAPSWEVANADPNAQHRIVFDAHTGEIVKRPSPAGQGQTKFTDVMLTLHRDLFAGLRGELLLAAMGVLFVAAIVSGAVLYAPFMRKLDFGTVRQRSRRLKWLDLHNLLGITTAAWTLVVGATGVMNELATPLFALWQRTDVAVLLKSLPASNTADASQLHSVQAAYDTAKAALPGMTVVSIVFPGSSFGSSTHYLLWAKGQTPWTSRLFNPVLVDAHTGEFAGEVPMPWYLRALEVSRPLHFGDYGSLPLKIIWALLDLMTIAVLTSGLYLWFGKRAPSLEMQSPNRKTFKSSGTEQAAH